MSYDVHTHTKRRAAKEHRCCECRGIIRKGDTHEVYSGIFEGDPYRHRVCADCGPVLDSICELHRKNGDDPIAFGDLYESIMESSAAEIAAFLKTKLRRCAEIPAWMWRRFKEQTAMQAEQPKTP